MKLYDREISGFLSMIEGISCKSWGSRELAGPLGDWLVFPQEQMILRSDMAYELGGEGQEAVSGLAFTMKRELVRESGVRVIGPDLPDIRGNCAYARMTLIRLRRDVVDREEQGIYSVLRQIEYVRYHLYPEGYMLRISASREREQVRIGRAAVKSGLTFAKIGACFNRAYESHEAVEAVETVFITQPGFDYQALKTQAHRFGRITDSLNYIYENLKMDCSGCGLKKVCDEVEGLRELHKLNSGTAP